MNFYEGIFDPRYAELKIQSSYRSFEGLHPIATPKKAKREATSAFYSEIK